jgi:Ca2+-binding RTX toxin-like protein
MSVADEPALLCTMTNRRRLPLVSTSGSAVAALALAAAWLSPPAVAAGGAQPTCAGHAATIVGTPGPDTLLGTSGDDVIVGLGGDDVVRGHGGDDVLCGGAGDDNLQGGKGSDVIRGGAGDDSIHDIVGISHIAGGAGNDSIEVFSSQGGDFRGGPGKDHLSVQGAHDRLFGGPDHDTLELQTAFWPDMVLSGGPGRDTALVDLFRHDFDGPGYRVVTADLAAGTLTANTSVSTLSGFENLTLTDLDVDSHSESSATSEKYVVYGTHGNNHLFMGVDGPQAPPTSVFGRGGDDDLQGGSANDLLNGGPGHDTGDGFRGTDTCVSVEVAKHCES